MTDLDERRSAPRALALDDPGSITRNLHQRLADQLGLAIVGGEFVPGEALPSEVKLCERLGVSRTAMREAIRGLVAKGLVESRPKVGTRIRRPEHWNHLDADVLRWQLSTSDTETYLRKAFQLRHATEPAAAAIAAEAADAGDHKRIRAAFQAMVDARDDNDAWVKADLRFHRAIYLATHNEFFWPIGQLFTLALQPMLRIAAVGSHRARAVEEHRDLHDAIVGGKPDLARAAALTLLRNAADDIVRIRDSGLADEKEVFDIAPVEESD
jgi:DNA-binding FadR family transcriptional regulator